MQQIVLHKFPNSYVKYKFKCRNKNVDFRHYLFEIKKEIKKLDKLRFQDSELFYLYSLGLFKMDYIDRLKTFRLNSKNVSIKMKGKSLDITIEGNWFDTILYEVFILAIVNEVYFSQQKNTEKSRKSRLKNKIKKLKELICIYEDHNNKFHFAEFGTRRRFSKQWQEIVVSSLVENFGSCNFVGVSNVYLAKQFNIKPIGTMAHEYLQACQAYARLIDSQKFALQMWADEYRGELGIALTDVIGIDAFLKDFDLYFMKLFDGLRHDSGDPIIWGEKVCSHYEKANIDLKTKNLVFSDGLNFEKAIDIYNRFKSKINMSFGIGTYLTNDSFIEPINIVIKMIECNDQAVAKLSDSPGKSMCEDDMYLRMLKYVFNI